MNNSINDFFNIESFEEPIYRSNLMLDNSIVEDMEILNSDIVEIDSNLLVNNIFLKFNNNIDPKNITQFLIDYFKSNNFKYHLLLNKYNIRCLVTDDNYSRYNQQFNNFEINGTASLVVQIFKESNEKNYIIVLRKIYGDQITFNNQSKKILEELCNKNNKFYKYIKF